MKGASFRVAERVVAAQGQPADRVAAFSVGEDMVLVVADGAGNSASGCLAAEAVVASIRGAAIASTFDARLPENWAELLSWCDQSVAAANHGGESTAVVICLSAGVVLGASVGDSEAWLLADGSTSILTEGQRRKPLLGTGRARPVPFKHHCGAGTLLAATDGLFKYVPPGRIRASMGGQELDLVAQELSEMPRMLSGALPDDIGLVLCRFRGS